MNKIKDKKIKIFILVAVLFTFISLFGTSYALYVGEDKGNENAYTTGLLDLSISEDSILSLNNPIPISDEEALTQTPYTITIKNTGTLSHTFDIKLLDTTTGNKLSLNYIKIKVDTQEVTTLDNLTNNIIKSNITLDPGKSITIKIIMWLDINTPNSEMGKTYTAKVTTSGYGNYTEPPEIATDKIIALSSGDSWESGASGVYATNSYTDTDGSTKYHEYRYVGANVNNYVSFNNDMYRIIGVFDSNSHGIDGEYLVKLISANPLGGYSWGVYNTSNTSGTYSGLANDWTGTTTGVKANLNVLLNEYFENKAVTSSTYGNCSDWTYFSNNTNYRTNDCSNILGYGIDSSLTNYIETTTWYLYGYDTTLSKQNWYICERGGNSCTSANSGSYSPTAEAKIGLMYLSDYMYASGYYSSVNGDKNGSEYYHGNQNWLYSGFEWTITPRASYSNYVWIVNDGGINSNFDAVQGVFSPLSIRPSFYLKSDVKISRGTGTFDDPYTLECDYC